MILLIYLRSFIYLILFVPFLMFCSILIITTNLLFNSRKIDDVVVKFWSWVSCYGCGVKVRLVGGEKIPPGGFVLLFNHTSFFDIFALHYAIPKIRFGAKIELFKIPVFGFAMRRAGALPIDRGNREEVFRIYEDAQKRLLRGERFVLAPEGTRQEDEDKLGPFKSGPFVFAINAKAQILPVVLKGAAGILPKNSILPNTKSWTSTITIHVLDPISTEGFDSSRRQELQKIVYDRMNAVLSA